MEEVKIRELPEKDLVSSTDYLITEDMDGTKKVLIKHFRSLILTSLYFENIDDLKNSTNRGLKEGDICETLGYHTPGDGGGAKYKITYNPGAIEDGKLVHYLSYSDTLRAELILEDTINVHQFGAVGDGKTDDTDAIQAAINYSDSKVVEFINNKIYVTKNPIKISANNTVIHGNGGILFPHYINGIEIKPADEVEDPVENIIINALHFDCSRSTSAIYAYRATKVDINECDIDSITTKGIELKNCTFINIDKCKFSSENNVSSCILLGGSEGITTPALSSRFINIDNCKFKEFAKAIHVLTTGNYNTGANTTINLTNCHYRSTVNGSTCIYLAAPIEIVNIRANSVDASNTFLYFGGASRGNVSCRDISCLGTSKIFDIGTTQGILTLEGAINADSTAKMFENMAGKLQSHIIWDLILSGASFTNVPIGELYDSVHPTQYNTTRGYSMVESKLTLHEARNMYIDWSSSTNNLTEIVNGIKGQLIFIKSSTNKSIVTTADTSVQLGPYSGILLKYDGAKWVQVSYNK